MEQLQERTWSHVQQLEGVVQQLRDEVAGLRHEISTVEHRVVTLEVTNLSNVDAWHVHQQEDQVPPASAPTYVHVDQLIATDHLPHVAHGSRVAVPARVPYEHVWASRATARAELPEGAACRHTLEYFTTTIDDYGNMLG